MYATQAPTGLRLLFLCGSLTGDVMKRSAISTWSEFHGARNRARPKVNHISCAPICQNGLQQTQSKLGHECATSLHYSSIIVSSPHRAAGWTHRHSLQVEVVGNAWLGTLRDWRWHEHMARSYIHTNDWIAMKVRYFRDVFDRQVVDVNARVRSELTTCGYGRIYPGMHCGKFAQRILLSYMEYSVPQ
ncbi:hypothetical protein BDU57DRAFT_596657 [Ampelomyces quisqualis]|uniref:Uncharacterized protein n=1 Tax=Ampelomyces quisqualis TaxID=50730 RepID=A0A6A5QGR4_AMPQU|nr:hypothetical protein BDU57DRAFT_596657 [Ampelomyces quisqualis]